MLQDDFYSILFRMFINDLEWKSGNFQFLMCTIDKDLKLGGKGIEWKF